jgi:predicted MPP superfamily phosphohydrolase
VIRLILFRKRPGGILQSTALVLLGWASTFLMFLLALALGGAVLRFCGLAPPAWAPWWGLGLAGLLMAWGARSAFAPARVVQHRVGVVGLHPDLEGLRIVQISDLHISRLFGARHVARLVEQVQALKPDLIAVTGDLVDGSLGDLAKDVRPLAELKAPLGVYYVTGNHEYFWDAEAWIREFRRLGFEVLDNRHRSLRRGQASLRIFGIPDPMAKHLGLGPSADLHAALADAPPADFSLLLAHQPSAWSLAEAAQVDLFLAGHTHGGQFFPFNLLIRLFHKYSSGLHRHNAKTWIHVHTGSGFWGPPSRLGVPPQIALLELGRD